jgi:hypothetical protein
MDAVVVRLGDWTIGITRVYTRQSRSSRTWLLPGPRQTALQVKPTLGELRRGIMFSIRFISQLLVSVVILLALATCSDSSSPEKDTTPPNVELYLSIGEAGLPCPVSVEFDIYPLNCSDNVSELSELKIRWDFDSDGVWDSDYQDIAVINQHLPDPLPVDSWSVTCEVKDLAGNSTVHTESIDLPDWLPVVPDLIVGEIEFFVGQNYSVATDTPSVGQAFKWSVSRRDWVTPGDHEPYVIRFFLDHVLVGETTETWTSDIYTCSMPFREMPDGIATAGLHEFTVVIDGAENVVETNEANNMTTRLVVVE